MFTESNSGGRGVGVGIVYGLSTASCCAHKINLTGWYMGGGPYKVRLSLTANMWHWAPEAL